MKKYFQIQILILLVGTLFAGYNVIKNSIRFYNYEGTLFKINDCVIPNPVTEACFYGAIAFLVALIWSIVIFRKYSNGKLFNKVQHYLWWFLSFGTIFALFNVTKEFAAFYLNDGPTLGCSSTVIVNPFLTPCFGGMVIFLIAALLAGNIHFKLTKTTTNHE